MVIDGSVFSDGEPRNYRITGLAGLKSLQSLALIGNKFADADADAPELDGLTQLHSLCLEHVRITSEALRQLRRTTELDWLMVGKTQIDNTAMPIIGQMTRLHKLDLFQTPLTDAGLESLKCLKNLRELDLNRTSVTAEGVRSLRQALPNCKINWSPPSP